MLINKSDASHMGNIKCAPSAGECVVSVALSGISDKLCVAQRGYSLLVKNTGMAECSPKVKNGK